MTPLIYIGILMALFYFWRNKMMGGRAAGVMSFAKSRGRVIEDDEVKTTFADVAGVDEAKEELEEIIAFLQTPEKYQRLGAKIPRGVLLVGPPGTGKTLLAKAVAGEANVPFISISGSEFVEMFVGVGAARVRDLFEQASRRAPCIIFIDELDALGRSRGNVPGMGSNEEREQTLNQLLVQMDGFDSDQSVIVMAATNRPEVLDPALLRPGRFDRQVVVDRPDRAGRLAILEVHSRGVTLGEDVELSRLAARTPGFAGADLANLINEAALLAARRDLNAVDMASFSDAIDRVIAGLKKKNRHLGEAEKWRVAHHEVGHALAGMLAGGEDIVHKISIVPRGVAALGFTMQMPDKESLLMTESSLRAKLVGLLGGRAAEEVMYGQPSTGAQNDIQKATEVARAMVIDYGMSEAVGPISVRSHQRSPFLAGKGGEVGGRRSVGDTLADTIDSEVQRLVAESLAQAKDLLGQNRESLDSIAGELFKSETLEGERLHKLLNDAVEQHKARTESN